MSNLELKNLSHPDEIRDLPKTHVEVANLNSDHTVMRATFQPGWKWSECVKPTAGTQSCQVAHTIYNISGRMKIIMDDGTEKEIGPGDVADIPPGHNAMVIGDEPCVMIDFSGGKSYAKLP